MSLLSGKHQTSLKHHSNLTQTSLKPHSNLTQTTLKPRSNLTQTSLKPHSNLTQTSPKPHSNLTQTLLKPCSNLTQTWLKPHSNLAQASHNLAQTSPIPPGVSLAIIFSAVIPSCVITSAVFTGTTGVFVTPSPASWDTLEWPWDPMPNGTLMFTHTPHYSVVWSMFTLPVLVFPTVTSTGF